MMKVMFLKYYLGHLCGAKMGPSTIIATLNTYSLEFDCDFYLFYLEQFYQARPLIVYYIAFSLSLFPRIISVIIT